MLMNRSNYLNGYNPFRVLDELGRSLWNEGTPSEIKIDIREDGDRYLLDADLPGFKKEDIHVELENDCLSIRAERRSEYEDRDEENGLLRSERLFGSFRRSFRITGVDAEHITAAYDSGVLHLTLPKMKKELPQVHSIAID